MRSGILDLFVAASAGGIADGPSSFLLDVKFGSGEQLDEGRDNLGVDDCLHPTQHHLLLHGHQAHLRSSTPRVDSIR
jgi:hypothetical protein